MAKVNHYSSIDVIENLLTDAKNRKILHLQIDEGNVLGRTIEIEKRSFLNFGTCGYMGLEKHPKVIEKAVEFTEKYGMQYSLSRVYASTEINEELEEKLGKIYNKPVIVYSSTSQAHISIIPIIVSSEDAVVLDQQAHISVQTGVQLLRQKGTTIEIIRHSKLDMLEKMIHRLKGKHKKIWYMVDGVYSMYGDTAPMKEIVALLDKYPQLHVYVDDAHGMSWEGKNGGGYIFNEVGLPEKVQLITTLAKGFGAIGGMAIFPNKEARWKIRVWGGPLTYSHPLSPPLLGAAHAIADIHLSDEIYKFQKEVQSNIAYCHELIKAKNLPLMSEPRIPIKFVGAGEPRTGYALLEGVLNDGFFVNIGVYPGVPMKNTGLRFTITRHVEKEDIKRLVDSVEKHYYRALEKEKTTNEKVRQAFRLPAVKKEESSSFKCSVYRSIKDIGRQEWDGMFLDRGNFDYQGLVFLEAALSGNRKPEDNFNFYYIIKKTPAGKIGAASFFTCGIHKDDFLSREKVSIKIEEKRKEDPYYLCSKTLAMGSLLTLGEHLYLDREAADWKENLRDLLHDLDMIRIEEKANSVVLRDFFPGDGELNSFLIEQGYVQIEMPNNNIIDLGSWTSVEEFHSGLSKNSRRHFKLGVKKFIDKYDVVVKERLTLGEIEEAYGFFLSVSSRNFGINIFPYPQSALEEMNNSSNWEFIVVYLKEEPGRAVSYCMCYKSQEKYMAVFLGLDYNCEYAPYRQSLFQAVLRAKELGYSTVDMGLSSDTEKRKFGARQVKLCMYTQVIDNYNMEVISAMGG